MTLSPKGFNEVAVKYAYLKKSFIISTVVLIVLFFILSNINHQNPYLSFIAMLAAILGAEAFFIAGFLQYFGKLDSSISTNPFWYSVTVAKEWLEVVMFVVLLLMPLAMAVMLAYGI
ncbi:hypothetical protein [Paraferrimonas sp. SM1919]|uniref:hypothetical protein n=1 Tax=Paraferrimonas sp. SM1919 TaxID=2662263 RepID=UPI0013D5AC81|nr:hypothetical protein [Paraferrimonas sp. SM1919]